MKSATYFVPLLLSVLGTAVAAPASGSATQTLVRRNYTEEYADQLVDGTACRDVTVIYARGTGQQGNIGEATDVGPLFLDDLAALVGSGNLAAQGVNYSADVIGFELGGDATGSALMAELATLVREDQTLLLSVELLTSWT
jgi:cutinase